MTDNLKVPTAILDKFAQKQGYKNYEDSKQYRSIEQIHWFRELASLAYSEGFEHKDFEQCEKSCPFVSQHKMEGKLAVLEMLEKHKNDITNNEAELNFGFGAVMLWLKSQLKEDGSKEAYEQAKRDEAHRGDDE